MIDKVGDTAWLGWRYAALTRGKDNGNSSDHSTSNDDGFFVRHVADFLEVVVIDVATRKVGISGASVLACLNNTFTRFGTRETPAELVAELHRSLMARLDQQVGARAAACALIVRANPEGIITWAHAGDAAFLLHRPQTWYRRSRLRLLNERHHIGPALTNCIGTRRDSTGLRVDEGQLRMRSGERLLACSDGVFHSAMPIKKLRFWLDAHQHQQALRTTADLVAKIECEARLTQPHPDDSTLVVIERMKP